MTTRSRRRSPRAAYAAPALIAVLIASILGGCGDRGPETPVVIPARDYVAEGWNAFEAGATASAAALFALALPAASDSVAIEAWTGIGWSRLVLGTPDSALAAFQADGLTAVASTDLLAGRAFAARGVLPPTYDFALVSAESVLTREPRYAFAHDPAMNWWGLRLVMAQSHFAIGDWLAAAADVDSLGGESPDPSSLTFVEDLLVEIQRLSLTGRSPPTRNSIL